MAPSQSLLLLSAMAVCAASLASGTRPVVRWRSSRLPTAARMQEGGAQEVLLEGSELTQTFDGEQYQFRGVDVLLPRGSKQGLVGLTIWHWFRSLRGPVAVSATGKAVL